MRSTFGVFSCDFKVFLDIVVKKRARFFYEFVTTTILQVA